MSNRWESEIDKAIREAVDNSTVNNLPGKGKPLQFDQDSSTPDEQRMALKIMRENEIVPEWVLMSRELETEEAALLKRIRRAAQDSFAAPPKLVDAVKAHNMKVLTFNLKAPQGINHRRQINLDREMARGR
jgi:enterochelin esterase family protein